MSFNAFQPWSDYSIMSTDYTTHSVVYGCDNFISGMIRFEWLWTLARKPEPKDNRAAYETTVFDIIKSKLSDYDPTTRLRPTEQTAAKGCVYSEYPTGWESISPYDQ